MNYRPRSESELKWRLECKGYSNEVTDTIIKHLKRLGYIDDRAFARYWITGRAGKKGSYGLRQELLSKGVHIDLVNEALAGFRPEDEFNSALKLARKKMAMRRGDCPYPLLAGFLQRKGFSYSVIKNVVQALGCGEI